MYVTSVRTKAPNLLFSTWLLISNSRNSMNNMPDVSYGSYGNYKGCIRFCFFFQWKWVTKCNWAKTSLRLSGNYEPSCCFFLRACACVSIEQNSIDFFFKRVHVFVVGYIAGIVQMLWWKICTKNTHAHHINMNFYWCVFAFTLWKLWQATWP